MKSDLAWRFINSSNCASVVAEQLREEGHSEERIEAALEAARKEQAEYRFNSEVYGDPAYGRRVCDGE